MSPSLMATIARCPVCGSSSVVRLPEGWDRGGVAPLVGCGNPWHYATRSLADEQDVEGTPVDALPPLSEFAPLGQRTSSPREARLEAVVEAGLRAMRLTREYVGEQTLPAIDGWEWHDWRLQAERALGYDVPGAAEALGLSEEQVRSLIESGVLARAKP